MFIEYVEEGRTVLALGFQKEKRGTEKIAHINHNRLWRGRKEEKAGRLERRGRKACMPFSHDCGSQEGLTKSSEKGVDFLSVLKP